MVKLLMHCFFLQVMDIVGGRGFESLEASPQLTFTKTKVLDNNIRIEAYRQGRRGAYVHGNR